MDHPDPTVTLHVDPDGLPAASSRKLRTAVTTVEHCLGLWQPFLTAATAHPLRVTITATDNPDPEPAEAEHEPRQATLPVRVPQDLLRAKPSRLAASLLDLLLPPLVAHAERHPHPQPPRFYEPPPDWEPPHHDAQLGIDMDDLYDGDVMIIGRHDGTPTDADTRECTLENYLCEHLESPGIAGIDSAFTTDTAVIWTLELLHGGQH